jgi:hypothetical protein
MSITDGYYRWDLSWRDGEISVKPAFQLTKDHYEVLRRIEAGIAFQSWMPSYFCPPNVREMQSQLYCHGYLNTGKNGVELNFKGMWALHCYRFGKRLR